MARYDINHTCGHNRTVQLYGNYTERQRKIEWYETQECPQCWGAKQRELEAAKPVTMTIQTNGLDEDASGNILAEVILTGGTVGRKDEIKSKGYRWTEVRGGVFDMLSTSRAPMAWIKRVPIIELDKMHPTAIALRGEAKQLGAKIVGQIGPMDLAMVAKRSEDKRKAAEAQVQLDAIVAEIPKPSRPICHPREAHPDAFWNKKYYGNDKYGYRYYAGGVSYPLTDDEYRLCMEYRKAMDVYNDRIKQTQTTAVA